MVEYAGGSADPRPGVIREPGDGSARRSDGVGRKIEGRGLCTKYSLSYDNTSCCTIRPVRVLSGALITEGCTGQAQVFSRTIYEQTAAKTGESIWQRLGHRRRRVGSVALGVVGAKQHDGGTGRSFSSQ